MGLSYNFSHPYFFHGLRMGFYASDGLTETYESRNYMYCIIIRHTLLHFSTRNIGQYMSVHVVLNILNELEKRHKCEAYEIFRTYFFGRCLTPMMES